MPPDKKMGRRPAKTTHPKITPAAAIITVPTGSTRRSRPVASASLYHPVPGRTLFSLSIRCPYCQGTHLGRVREERQAAGRRRVPCGPVQVVVRRVYRPVSAGLAA
jgi:hypothetical protein